MFATTFSLHLKTPKPTQPYNDPRYHNLLDTSAYPYTSPYPHSRSAPPRPRQSSPSSTNPSPSSTLCSASSSGTSRTATTFNVEEVDKESQPSASSSNSPSVASPSKRYGPDMSISRSSQSSSPSGEIGCHSKSLKCRAGYERWMLNAEAGAYSTIFSPSDLERENEELDGGGGGRESKRTFQRGQEHDPEPPSSRHKATPPPQPTATYRHTHPNKRWSTYFDLGCRNRDRDARLYYARRVIQSQRWDGSEDNDRLLLELVHAFVWRATGIDVDPQEREGVASFAARIRVGFKRAFHWVVPRPKGLDERFGALMRETVLATFISCWHVTPENLNAITYTFPDSPSSSYISYATSALHLCSFIGDLYVEKFLSRSDTIGCIRIILHNLSLVDHLTAIGNILKRTGTILWKEATAPLADPISAASTPDPWGLGIDNLDREVAEFEAQMWRALQVVQDHRFLLAVRCGESCSSATGRELAVAGVTRRKVEDLVRYVRECRVFVREGCIGSGEFTAIGAPER